MYVPSIVARFLYFSMKVRCRTSVWALASGAISKNARKTKWYRMRLDFMFSLLCLGGCRRRAALVARLVGSASRSANVHEAIQYIEPEGRPERHRGGGE